MYTSPTLTNANIKSIIFNTLITTRLRFQLREMIIEVIADFYFQIKHIF